MTFGERPLPRPILSLTFPVGETLARCAQAARQYAQRHQVTCCVVGHGARPFLVQPWETVEDVEQRVHDEEELVRQVRTTTAKQAALTAPRG